MMNEKRRSYDGEIAGIRKSLEKNADASVSIALSIQKIELMQQNHIDHMEKVRNDTDANTKEVSALRSKMKLVIWSGGSAVTFALLVLGISFRFALSHLHIKGP